MDSEMRGASKDRPQDPLHWDNMRDDIFAKVLEEDPHFFSKPGSRKGLLWMGLLGLILIVVLTVLVLKDDNTSRPLDESKNALYKTSALADSDMNTELQTSGDSMVDLPDSTQLDRAFAINDNGAESKMPEGGRQSNETAPTRSETAGQSGVGQKINKDDVTADRSLSAGEKAEANRRITIVVAALNTPRQYGIRRSNVPSEYPGPSEFSALQESLPDTEQLSRTPLPNRWSMILSAGGMISATGLKGSADAVQLRNQHTSPLFGYQLRLGVNAPVGGKTFVTGGLSYLQAFRNIDISTEREIQVTQHDVLLEVTHFVVGNRTTKTYGDTTVAAIEKNRLVYTNSYRWLHLDLGAGYNFTRSRWTFSPSLGMAIGKLWAEGYTVANDGAIIPISAGNSIYQSESWKLWGGLNVTRAIGKKFGIVLTYRLEKQLNNASSEEGIIYKPVFHSLNFGVAMNLR